MVCLFSVPFDEDEREATVWFLDHDYLENMYGMFKKVNGWYLTLLFKPPPPVGAGGGYMFSGHPSVHASVRLCVRDSRGSFVSAIFPVSVDGFLPNFCHWCVSGQT